MLQLLALVLLTTATAPEPRPGPWPPQGYACLRSPGPVEIDGRLDEAAWNTAPWTESFVDIEGELRPNPRLRTRAKMLWDDEFFYVAAEMEEPHLWATLRERDSVIYYDNDFEVFVDPDGDSHLYTEIELNAFNTVWDLLLVRPYRDGGPAIHAWDIPGLKTAVHVDGTVNDPSDVDRAWSVEIAIPFSVLDETTDVACPPLAGDRWRVNFSRVQWKLDEVSGGYRKSLNPDTGKSYPEDNWVWSPQRQIAMHEPEHWGIVEFRESDTETPVTPSADDAVAWHLRYASYYLAAHFEGSGVYPASFSIPTAPPGAPLVGKSWQWPPVYWSDGIRYTLTAPGDDHSVHLTEDGRLRSVFLGVVMPLRRDSSSPLLRPRDIPAFRPDLCDVSSVFNPGATLWRGRELLLLRVQTRGRTTVLLPAERTGAGEVHVVPAPVEIRGLESLEVPPAHIYDPRLTMIDDTLYAVLACDFRDGCRLLTARTTDFERWEMVGLDAEGDRRNGVLFPERIAGRFVRLHRSNRVSREGSLRTGDTITLATSEDLRTWEEVGPVMAGRHQRWDELIGSGPPPVKTHEGWLHVYHGVATHFAASNIYQAGVVLLDLQDPTRVVARGAFNILEPREPWELTGQVPNVVFPSGMVVEQLDGEGFADPRSEVRIYYGAADTVAGLATTTVAELLDDARFEG